MTLKRYAAIILVEHDPLFEGEEIAETLLGLDHIRALNFHASTDEGPSEYAIVYATSLDPVLGLEEILDNAGGEIEDWDTRPETLILSISEKESDEEALARVEALIKVADKDILIGGSDPEPTEEPRTTHPDILGGDSPEDA